jgi:hypothetical protein
MLTLSSPSNEGTLVPEWTFSILLESGISFKVAFDSIYNIMERDHNRMFISGSGSHRRLQNMEIAVSMLESFVDGIESSHDGYPSTNVLELKTAIERVRVELQSIPENVAMVENRLYDVEHRASRIAKFF